MYMLKQPWKEESRLRITIIITHDKENEIRELNQILTYKYFGINELDTVQDVKMKEKIRKEFYTRIRLILKTEFNVNNMIVGLITPAVSFISYIPNRTLGELFKLDG